jgi:hypothetical protein
MVTAFSGRGYRRLRNILCYTSPMPFEATLEVDTWSSETERLVERAVMTTAERDRELVAYLEARSVVINLRPRL